MTEDEVAALLVRITEAIETCAKQLTRAAAASEETLRLMHESMLDAN